MAIVQLCRSGLAAGKTLKSWHDSALNERERELLVSASRDGIFHLGQNDFDGRFVATNSHEFTDPNDAAVTAHYLDAFISLCERGLILDQNGDDLFRLTGQGFDIGRKLAAKSG
ncbi:MAG TPA: hypothetical protein VGI40_20835 [Pirellulaceae bacterium]